MPLGVLEFFRGPLSQFDPKIDEKLRQEYMDELHVMRCGTMRVAVVGFGCAVLQLASTGRARHRVGVVASRRELNHPNIVKFLGACVRPPKLCYLMELCRASLYKLLHESRTPLSDQEIVNYAV